MKLENLNIRQMPGFKQGGPVLEKLSDGLNIVVGTNGSGKTTICKAIRGLLSKECLVEVKPVDVSSRWNEKGDKILLERHGSSIQYQAEGIEKEPPVSLPKHLVNCFTITHDDLTVSSPTHEKLTEEVLRQTAGGYDLGALREDSRIKLKARHGQGDLKEFHHQKIELRRLQGEQEILWEEEQNLANLEGKKQKARKAETTLRQLDKAIEFIDAKEKLNIVEKGLAQFPPAMDRILGDEIQQFKQIERDLNSENENLNLAAKKEEAAINEITDTQLENDIPESSLVKNRERLNHAKTLESRLSELNAQGKSYQARFKKAEEDLEVIQSNNGLINVDVQKLDSIENFYDQSVALKEKKEWLLSRIKSLSTARSDLTLETIGSGMNLLRSWLRIPNAPSWIGLMPRWVIWVNALILSVFTLFVTVTLYIWALVFLLPVVLILLSTIKNKTDRFGEEKTFIVKQYSDLNLHEIESWNIDQVERKLKEIEHLFLDVQRAKKESDDQKTWEADLNTNEVEETALERQWADFATELGIKGQMSNLSVVHLSRRFLQYKESWDNWNGNQKKLETVQSELSKVMEDMNRFFTEFGHAACLNVIDASAALDELVQRNRKFIQNRANRMEAGQTIKKSESNITEFLERKQKLFSNIGLTTSDEFTLKERLQKLEAYQKAKQEHHKTQTELDVLKEQLKDNPKFTALSREEIEDLVFVAKEEAERFEKINEEIQIIKVKVENAKQTHDIENCLDKLNFCRENVLQNRGEALFSNAGLLLMDLVESEFEASAQPPVIKEADRLFSIFTNGRYTLKANPFVDNDAKNLLRIFDTQKEEWLSLEKLSTGTLVQLLLAVRIAFATLNEGDSRLPILLDETLNSSDPERFGAIADCLLKLIEEENRQIFYFTCQPVDADVWKAHAVNAGYNNTVTFNLDEEISKQKVRRAPFDLQDFQSILIPSPDGRTLDEYGKMIFAPGFDPSAPIGELHLIHVIDTLELLYKLLLSGIKTWGQILALMDKGRAELFIPPEKLFPANSKAKLLDAFAQAWRIGRGKLIDRDTLLDAGITPTFIDPVMEIAKEVSFDAEAIIKALEDKQVKAIRASSIVKTKDSLMNEGYIDTRPILAKDQVFIQVLAEMGAEIESGRIEKQIVLDTFERYWNILSS